MQLLLEKLYERAICKEIVSFYQVVCITQQYSYVLFVIFYEVVVYWLLVGVNSGEYVVKELYSPDS